MVSNTATAVSLAPIAVRQASAFRVAPEPLPCGRSDATRSPRCRPIPTRCRVDVTAVTSRDDQLRPICRNGRPDALGLHAVLARRIRRPAQHASLGAVPQHVWRRKQAELQCLTPNNVYTKDGALHIVTRRENVTCPNGSQRRFTSGFIGTREKPSTSRASLATQSEPSCRT